MPRVDESVRRKPPGIAEPRVPLRLTVTRGRLGIELYESLRLGPVEVSALSVSLPNLKFPVDLSGGVPTFRHRRGQLEHARLNVALPDLAKWLGPRLQEVVGSLERPVSLWTGPATVGVGLTGSRGALAFNLIWAPEGSAARWVVTGARGSGLAAPALGYALRAVDAMLPGAAERNGRVVTIPRAAHLLSCELLPRFGARVPALTDVRFGALLVKEGDLVVELDVSFPHFAPSSEGLAAMELASLVVAADDALAAAATDDARACYIRALERAPRHPELLGIVAEIDACAEHRAEAALAMLCESGQAMQAGAVGATLLAQVGDIESAVQAFAAAARDEPYSPLSALHWLSSATFESDPRSRASALDQAVATCPDLASVRWARVEARLYWGDVQGAQADLECLEAAAHGTLAKYREMRRGAEALLRAGYIREARAAYERSLRYLPADAEATAGLARALLELGQVDRSAALFERAIRLAEQQGTFDPACVVELAKILASHARDLPAAIARVRQVSGDSEAALQARALEARWRWALGDISGASIAFGRLREAIEVAPQVPRGASVWLAEAANFAHEVEGDLAAAELCLATALRVDPHDAKVQRAYRRAASALATRRRIQQQRSGHSTDEPPSKGRPR